MSIRRAQYFILALIATAIGATLLAGWGNAVAASAVGILAGRRTGRMLTDPRLGRWAGIGIGLWVGLGAIAGQIVASLIARAATHANVIFGQTLILAIFSFSIALFAAAIAGREAAQPIEEEEIGDCRL